MANDMINPSSAVTSSVVSGDMSGRKAAQAHSTASETPVVAVDTATMGRGNDELGKVLMKGFLFAVTQLDELPKAMLFYNC